MTRSRRLICSCGLAIAISALSAGTASASTFFVNGSTGKDTNACTEAGAPCKTIGAAVTKSELASDNATIEVAAGVYEELVGLANPADSGIAINGAGSGPGGTEIEGPEKTSNATVAIGLPGGTVTLSNLSVVNKQKEDTGKGIVAGAHVTLTNVTVDMESAGEANGIEAGQFGSLSLDGGSVTMGSGTKGTAIMAQLNPVTITNSTVTVAGGSTGGGIVSQFSPASISNTTVNLAPSAEHGGITDGLASVSLSNVSVVQGGTSSSSYGLEFALPSPLSLSGVNVTMTNAASKAAGVIQLLGTSTFEHLTVGGAWSGPAFEAEGGNITLRDSRITQGLGSLSPALVYFGGSELPGLVIQRSVLQANATASPGVLTATNANLTIDSSEVLGGHSGVSLQQAAGKVRTLTVAGSTIDAGNLGVTDGAGVAGVSVVAAGSNGIANANIEGSILLEPQSATVAALGKEANVRCAGSDVPSQSQPAKGTEGEIACGSAANGNASSEPATLFASPITNYQLNPSSGAIDSVGAGAITLPFGLMPSSTDLAGNPRVVDGNGDCAAVQDKGALELQGHSTTCPPAPSPLAPKPVAGAISALTISPSAFFAAPSGATISKAKRHYGTKVSYRNSQASITTFTVLRQSTGRKQGKSCRKPSKGNRHGRRCTLSVALGSFSHNDQMGTNSLHFSGRLKGRKLPKGAYKLQAVPHNAAGNGAAVSRSFTIK
jgi:hypothetical protein